MNAVPSRHRGAAWMLVAGICFSLMGVCVKEGAVDFGPTELVFWRSLFGLLLLLGVAARQSQPFTTRHWRLHLARSVSGLISLWLYFFALAHLPLATAVTLNYTSPLFLALILYVKGQTAAQSRLLWFLGLGFVGVVMLLQPHLQPDQWVYAGIGLLSGVGASISYYQIRSMGALGEPDWRIVLYFTGLSTVVTGLFLPFQPHHPLTWHAVVLLASLGVFATCGQLSMTRAYRVGTTLVVANFAYATIVFSALFGVVVFHEAPPWLSWAGMMVIILAGVGASWARSRTPPSGFPATDAAGRAGSPAPSPSPE
ncbi:MAG: DMT family transporter [Ferrovum sp.]|nr:DMT family transporter [Ferrovum sp.]NDU86585.1 DMT family transporter [Ferrovum sp.]